MIFELLFKTHCPFQYSDFNHTRNEKLEHNIYHTSTV